MADQTPLSTDRYGATAINTAGTGDGAIRKVAGVSIAGSSGAMSFAAGQLMLSGA